MRAYHGVCSAREQFLYPIQCTVLNKQACLQLDGSDWDLWTTTRAGGVVCVTVTRSSVICTAPASG